MFLKVRLIKLVIGITPINNHNKNLDIIKYRLYEIKCGEDQQPVLGNPPFQQFARRQCRSCVSVVNHVI